MDARIEATLCRTSVLIERGKAAEAMFRATGRDFSADLTRQFVTALESGAPAALYEHWVSEQVKLAGGEA